MKLKNKFLSLFLGVLFSLGCCFPVGAAHAEYDIDHLQVNDLDTPVIDTPPRFRWRMTSERRGMKQTAYRIIVGTDSVQVAAGNGDMWDSGKTETATSLDIPYEGKSLSSNTVYYWRVCLWDEHARKGVWSDVTSFSTALLRPEDWQAQWITVPRKIPHYSGVEIRLEQPVRTRFLRLGVTRIGMPVDENGWWRVQLAEIEVFGPEREDNEALYCPVSISREYAAGGWSASRLTDGITVSTADSPGGTSEYYTTDTPETPLYITLDLGQEKTVDRIVLYPRNDVASRDDASKSGSFPRDFTIETRIGQEGDFTLCHTVKNQETPSFVPVQNDMSLPLLGKQFSTNKTVKRAVLYASGQGLFEITLNGRPVTSHVLEPGESCFRKTLLYAAYDVTGLLRQGENTLIATLGNGIYHNPYTNRYQKLNVVYGPLRLLGQMEIEYTDGSRERVVTDLSWKTTSSPYTFSAWYGGEDYDARQEIPGLYAPGYSLEGWSDVLPCETPEGKLKVQFYPPTQVVETWKAKRVTSPEAGVYLVDFGQNFAGQYEFSMEAPAGTTIQLWPSEALTSSGRADQTSTGGPTYETYTFRGGETEQWGPKFVYHGFRYLEIRGLPVPPQPEMFTAKRIRAGNRRTGSFEASNPMLNSIDTLISRSIESNMYNTLTDCPHREKLGWLEVPALMFNSITAGYDVAAWIRKIVMDAGDAQLPDGMVPSTAPEHTIFWGPFRDDPTWGGSAIMLPWLCYETYGDRGQLEQSWPVMVRLMNYLASKSNGYLLNHGLGEWGAYDKSTSVGFTESCTYYLLAQTMMRSAQVLGKQEEANRYDLLAQDIRKALNSTYYHSDQGSYDSGSQAANAMALYYNIVPEGEEERVLEQLVRSVEKEKYHLTTGEIALKPLFLSLARYGRNDVVYQMAVQTSMPSYGYFIERGATSLPEYWDMVASQNHCMMGHLQGWFYEHLAGIRPGDDGGREIEIAPYFAPELQWVRAHRETAYGKVSSAWERTAEGDLLLTVTVPVGSSATVRLPGTITQLLEGEKPLKAGKKGIVSLREKENEVEVKIGSGVYSFRVQSI